MTRGGQQRIPRPETVRSGSLAPWEGVVDDPSGIDLALIRRRFTEAGDAHRSPREGLVDLASAVLAPLYEHDGRTHVILTRRSAALRVHSGEVSFPGGRQEPGEDLAVTAAREAHEEIGLDPGSLEILGELDHLSTFTSNSFIVPFVAALPGRPELHPNPSEVDAVLHVPLDELLHRGTFHEEIWEFLGAERPMWFFELEGDTVWGATAAMLRQLLGLVTGTVARGGMGHP